MLAYNSQPQLLSQNQSSFIQEVVDFIDAPLSPKTLNKLRRQCREQMPRDDAAPAASAAPDAAPPSPRPAADLIAGSAPASTPAAPPPPPGGWMEVHGLLNTPEFNGLTARIVGGDGSGKLFIEFLGAPGQVYDIPPQNLRAAAGPHSLAGPRGASEPPPAPTPQPAPLPAPRSSPPPPEHPSGVGSYGSLPAPRVAALQERLRCAMSHVEAAPEAVEMATLLHAADHAALISVIEEFQPTLSRATIERNWYKIVQIYQAHAERVAHGAPPPGGGGAAAAPAAAAPYPGADPLQDPALAVVDDEMVSQLRGVIDFIDRPLSPRALQDIRSLRRQQREKAEGLQ